MCHQDRKTGDALAKGDMQPRGAVCGQVCFASLPFWPTLDVSVQHLCTGFIDSFHFVFNSKGRLDCGPHSMHTAR